MSIRDRFVEKTTFRFDRRRVVLDADQRACWRPPCGSQMANARKGEAVGWKDAVTDVQAQARRLAESVSSGARAQAEALPGKQGPAMKITRLPLSNVDLQQLADALARWYRSQNLEAQVTPDDPGVRVQCRGHNARALAGAAIALTVIVRQEREGLAVEIGEAKWGDKRVAAGVGLLTLSSGVGLIPLASSAWGSWQQAKMPARTIEFIQATAPSCVTPAVRARSSSGASSGRVQETSASADPSEGSRASGARQPVDVNKAGVTELRDQAGLSQRAAESVVAQRAHLRGFGNFAEVQEVLREHLQPHELAAVRAFLVLGSDGFPAHAGRPDPPVSGRPGTNGRGGRVLDLDDSSNGT